MNRLFPTFLFLMISFFFLLHCERFIGYDLDSDEIKQTARIYGNITNSFTGSPVAFAQVSIEYLKTESDGRGNYLILFVLREDEVRNRPVRIEVTAENYLPFSGEFLLYPPETEFDFSLDYGAPIIRKNVLVYNNPINTFVCQALVVDYQGISTLNEVKARFSYSQRETYLHKMEEIEMEYISSVTDTTAYYQCLVYLFLNDGWELQLRSQYEIVAADRDGYSQQIFSIYKSGATEDTLLFPPVLP